MGTGALNAAINMSYRVCCIQSTTENNRNEFAAYQIIVLSDTVLKCHKLNWNHFKSMKGFEAEHTICMHAVVWLSFTSL